MWNKADIRTVLLSCETSIAPFFTSSVKSGQYFDNYRRSFRLGRRTEGSWISAKIETNSVTKANTCSEKHKDYVEIFLLLGDMPTSPSSTVSSSLKLVSGP